MQKLLCNTGLVSSKKITEFPQWIRVHIPVLYIDRCIKVHLSGRSFSIGLRHFKQAPRYTLPASLCFRGWDIGVFVSSIEHVIVLNNEIKGDSVNYF